MMCECDGKISVKQVLLPINIIALTLVILCGLQFSQLLSDHSALKQNREQQEQAVNDSQRLRGQLTALIMGAQKLAEDGNKNVQPIVEKLRAMGVAVVPTKALMTPPGAAPGAALPPTQGTAGGANPPVPQGAVPVKP